MDISLKKIASRWLKVSEEEAMNQLYEYQDHTHPPKQLCRDALCSAFDDDSIYSPEECVEYLLEQLQREDSDSEEIDRMLSFLGHREKRAKVAGFYDSDGILGFENEQMSSSNYYIFSPEGDVYTWKSQEGGADFARAFMAILYTGQDIDDLGLREDWEDWYFPQRHKMLEEGWAEARYEFRNNQEVFNVRSYQPIEGALAEAVYGVIYEFDYDKIRFSGADEVEFTNKEDALGFLDGQEVGAYDTGKIGDGGPILFNGIFYFENETFYGASTKMWVSPDGEVYAWDAHHPDYADAHHGNAAIAIEYEGFHFSEIDEATQQDFIADGTYKRSEFISQGWILGDGIQRDSYFIGAEFGMADGISEAQRQSLIQIISQTSSINSWMIEIGSENHEFNSQKAVDFLSYSVSEAKLAVDYSDFGSNSRFLISPEGSLTIWDKSSGGFGEAAADMEMADLEDVDEDLQSDLKLNMGNDVYNEYRNEGYMYGVSSSGSFLLVNTPELTSAQASALLDLVRDYGLRNVVLHEGRSKQMYNSPRELMQHLSPIANS